MKIVYALESTGLYGGTKVILRQAEALTRRGHEVTVVSPEPFPAWFEGSVDFSQASLRDAGPFRQAHWVIGTYFRHMSSLFSDRMIARKLWHLSQGYEGGWPEAAPDLPEIEKVYRLPIPKMTVSPQLTKSLGKRFPGRFYSVGQGIETQYFYHREETATWTLVDKLRVFLVGTFPASVKNIATGLTAVRKARHRLGSRLQLVRITTQNTREAEERLYGPIDNYYVHLAPRKMGELFRSGGILLSPYRKGEGFGLPPMEAMACGIPTVITSIPSFLNFAELADYSIFVSPEDPDQMADAICFLAGHPDKAKRLAHRGIEVASRYSFKKVAGNIERTLRMEYIRRLCPNWLHALYHNLDMKKNYIRKVPKVKEL